MLGFEGAPLNGMPQGWAGGPPNTITADSEMVHSGKYSVRIQRTDSSASRFSSIAKTLPVDFKGATVTLRGYIRASEVSEYAGLWLRLDGENGVIALDNMSKQKLAGTRDWRQYSVTLRLTPETRRVVFGFLLGGTGTAWADDLELLVNETPLTAIAPVAIDYGPSLPEDHQFDKGSGVSLQSLSPEQIESLTLLGQIWGFLKYHHPQVAAGKLHWDYQLLRALPSVLAATPAERNKVMLKFVQDAGSFEDCTQCATLSTKDLHLRPALDWISDRNRLGDELSSALVRVHRNRPQRQFFLKQFPGVGNPQFEHEFPYRSLSMPDPGFQLIGLYRYWNMVEYWFPYRDIIGEPWVDVLRRSIAPVALAQTTKAYKRELIRLIAATNDTHANLWSSLDARPPQGDCELPVSARFIGSKLVVWSYRDSALGPKSGLQLGDAIVSINGRAVDDLVREWSPLYAASNEPTRLRDIARGLAMGQCGSVKLNILRAEQASEITVERVKANSLNQAPSRDLGGSSYRLLSPQVAYTRIGGLKKAEVASLIEMAKATKGLIIDIRNYPSDFPIYELAGRLTTKPTDFFIATEGDLANPGAFHFRGSSKIIPLAPHYPGKVVVLVDETAQSSAEFHAMAFRAAGAVVVGSTTAAADGNVSRIVLPPQQSTMFSGIGIFYPDRKPTQRVGIVPDVVAIPTAAGVAAGRDEVVEAAIRLILGPQADEAEIRRIAKR